jgi:hypothetical protein
MSLASVCALVWFPVEGSCGVHSTSRDSDGERGIFVPTQQYAPAQIIPRCDQRERSVNVDWSLQVDEFSSGCNRNPMLIIGLASLSATVSSCYSSNTGIQFF